MESRGLLDICQRAKKDLGGCYRTDNFYLSSSSSLPSSCRSRDQFTSRTTPHHSVFLYSKGEYLEDTIANEVKSNSMEARKHSTPHRSEARINKRNCGPDQLFKETFSDTNIGLANTGMSFTSPKSSVSPVTVDTPSPSQDTCIRNDLSNPRLSASPGYVDNSFLKSNRRTSFNSSRSVPVCVDTPTLSREGLEYTVPMTSSQNFTARSLPPRTTDDSDKVLLKRGNTERTYTLPLQRKPLSSSYPCHSTSVRAGPSASNNTSGSLPLRAASTSRRLSPRSKTGNLPFSEIMQIANTNTQQQEHVAAKKQKMSALKSGSKVTSYTRETVNFATKSAPPKLKSDKPSKVQVTLPDSGSEQDSQDQKETSQETKRQYSLRNKARVKTEDKLLLKYQPEGCKMAVELFTSDTDTLMEGEFLNDKIIDFYLKYIMFEKLKKELWCKLHIFSSFFYTRLCNSSMDNKSKSLSEEERMHSRVKTWTRHVDLFTKDYVVMPICDRSHWYVLMIQRPGEFDHTKAVPATTNKRKNSKRKHTVKRKTRSSSSASLVLCEEDELEVDEDKDACRERMEVEEDSVGEERETKVGGDCIPVRTVADLVAQDPLHMKMYEEEGEEEEELQGITKEGQESRREVVPTATREASPSSSSLSSSSYHSCFPLSPTLDRLRNDGVSMWEGASSVAIPTTTTSTSSSIDLTQQPQATRSMPPPLEVYQESPPSNSQSIESSSSGGSSVQFTQSPYFSDKDNKLNSDLVVLAGMENVEEKKPTQPDSEDKDSQEEQEDEKCLEPCILVLDSLGIRRPAAVRRVRKYLSQEWIVKKDKSIEAKFECLRVVYPKIPLQNNSSDCGIYVLQFVETLAECLNASTPLPSSTDEWGTAKVTKKRSELTQLISKLAPSSYNINPNQ